MLDHKYYAHVFDMVLSHLDVGGLITMRLTSRAVNERVCSALLRHVVVSHKHSNKNKLVLLDPYHHKRLFILDRKVPAAQRLSPHDSDDESKAPPTTPVWKQALARLLKHTRILDFQTENPATDRSYLVHWRTVLEPLAAKVDIKREVSVGPPFASRPSHPRHQQSLLLYIRTGDLTTEEFAASHYSTTRLVTRGLVKNPEELLVFVYQKLVTIHRVPTDPELMEHLCRCLTAPNLALDGVKYTHLTFVEVTSACTPPLASDWDTFLFNLGEKIEALPLAPEISLSHLTLQEFQECYRMSSFDVHMLTALPTITVPAPAEWKFYKN